MNPHIKTGHGIQLVSSCLYSSVPDAALSADYSTFPASCMLNRLYLSVYLYFWLSVAKDCELLKLNH